MKYKQWRVASSCPEVRRTLEAAGVSPLLAELLAARGVKTLPEARALLSPTREPLNEPLLMRDMDRAVARFRKALEDNELVAVYGDYDVDGITSTCLLTEYFTGLGGRIVPYIPGRLDEGYGLNREAVAALAEEGVTLIITVDCGITAVEEVAFAAALGVDVIVTDHHACKEELPAAVAVVNPQRPDCPYPFKGLAGVGVALKLAMAVAGDRAEAVFEHFCDLAAVGTIADVMPMTGENRAIVSRGLRYLNPPRRLGLASLLQAAGLGEKPVTTVSVGYTLAPRINASGRLGQAEVAAKLLLTQIPEQAEELAQTLCELNRERQAIEGEIFDQCVERLDREPQTGAIVLADEHWHQGVVGIVASRLAERYGCPTFMICLDQGVGKGSCRSWGGVNLFRLLTECAPLLESFGGHALAAGFSVREEHIPALAQALRAAVEQVCRGEELPSVLEVDAVADPETLDVPAVEALELLEPCGAGCPRPVMVLLGAQVQTMSQVGRGRHLKMRLESRGRSLDAIYFSADGTQLGVTPGCRVDVAFYPQINEFRDNRTVQLQVIDLRLAPSRAEMERAIYEKFSRGEVLTQEEARFLLPERSEFAALWRWLVHQTGQCAVVEDTLHHIARGAARRGGTTEVPARTLLCLEVFRERGLIQLARRDHRYRITLCPVERKVDLEASELLLRLHRLLDM